MLVKRNLKWIRKRLACLHRDGALTTLDCRVLNANKMQVDLLEIAEQRLQQVVAVLLSTCTYAGADQISV